ncbi:hypothetical protein ABPG75_009260 [Micractinium tetrahymenae]
MTPATAAGSEIPAEKMFKKRRDLAAGPIRESDPGFSILSYLMANPSNYKSKLQKSVEVAHAEDFKAHPGGISNFMQEKFGELVPGPDLSRTKRRRLNASAGTLGAAAGAAGEGMGVPPYNAFVHCELGALTKVVQLVQQLAMAPHDKEALDKLELQSSLASVQLGWVNKKLAEERAQQTQGRAQQRAQQAHQHTEGQAQQTEGQAHPQMEGQAQPTEGQAQQQPQQAEQDLQARTAMETQRQRRWLQQQQLHQQDQQREQQQEQQPIWHQRNTAAQAAMDREEGEAAAPWLGKEEQPMPGPVPPEILAVAGPGADAGAAREAEAEAQLDAQQPEVSLLFQL